MVVVVVAAAAAAAAAGGCSAADEANLIEDALPWILLDSIKQDNARQQAKLEQKQAAHAAAQQTCDGAKQALGDKEQEAKRLVGGCAAALLTNSMVVVMMMVVVV